MAYLVDSDVMVDLTRGSGGAADYLDGLADAWSISAITCLELLAGARPQRETTDLDLVLSSYRAIPPNQYRPPSVHPHEALRIPTDCTHSMR